MLDDGVSFGVRFGGFVGLLAAGKFGLPLWSFTICENGGDDENDGDENEKAKARENQRMRMEKFSEVIIRHW